VNAIGIHALYMLIVPCGFPLLIVGTILHPNTYFSRFLESAPMRFLGRISYSLYLWQQLFFIGQHEDFRAIWPFGLLQSRTWSIAPLLVIALASYFFIEKPFIRLGHRLARPVTPGRIDLQSEATLTRPVRLWPNRLFPRRV
jgi:peptidoglycan/LPS O-acetylase OafA/YrhL